MFRIDPQQFSKENKMLFQEGRWFIFLDLGDLSATEVYPRLAHRCKPEDRDKQPMPGTWSNRQSCCLIIADNQVCRDCAAPVPRVFQGFFNLAKWSFE